MEVSEDFIRFLKEYSVIGLAIAIVIGTAAKDLVNAFVENVLMPIIGVILPGESWREATVTLYQAEFGIGHIIGALLDFLIIAFLVYLTVRYLIGKEEVEKV
ncbi:MAG: MscL family protein [Candidatus Nanohaloarchaeota archaeon QJJ-7]|nr:MscL family protein [Candidatus Nanohaloarchaeota archaeon QJJ-7]